MMRSTFNRPVSLSSSYFTFEPSGISITAWKSRGSSFPGETSCQACNMADFSSLACGVCCFGFLFVIEPRTNQQRYRQGGEADPIEERHAGERRQANTRAQDVSTTKGAAEPPAPRRPR